MKKLIFPLMILFHLTVLSAQSQHVRVRMNFPVGISVNPPVPAPFRGAIWIGPEWRWDRGQYVHVPGYWATPKKRHYRWVSGRWKQTRRGYVWVPGRWR